MTEVQYEQLLHGLNLIKYDLRISTTTKVCKNFQIFHESQLVQLLSKLLSDNPVVHKSVHMLVVRINLMSIYLGVMKQIKALGPVSNLLNLFQYIGLYLVLAVQLKELVY